MPRGAQLIIGIGCVILAAAVVARGRLLALHLTEGEALVVFWPLWLLAGGLAAAAVFLLRGHR